MVLVYNIHYEVAAAAFAAILFLYVRMFYGTNKKSSLAFQRLIIVLLICDILDVVTAITISAYQFVPWTFNMILNSLYFAFSGLLGYAFLDYAKQYTYKDLAPKILTIIGKAVLAVYLVALVANWFNGWIFYLDPVTGYRHGFLYNATFSVPLFYVIGAMVLFSIAPKERSRGGRGVLILYSLIGLSGPALQIVFFNDVLLTYFSIIIGLVLIMFTLESPDYDQLVSTMKELEEQIEKLL